MSCCCFASQSTERLKSPEMKRKRPVGGSIYLSIKSPPPKRKRRDGGNHVGTSDRGPGETVPNPTPDPKSGKSQKSRNLEKQAAPVGHSKRSHFDKRMNELIDAIRILAGEQHTDIQKIESGVGDNTQIGQAIMQYLTELTEIDRGLTEILIDKMTVIEDRLANIETSVENLANDRDDSSPPDAEVPSPEVTQVAGPVVADTATPKMERKSKSFEPSLTCARDAEILTDEFMVRKNKAEKVVTAVSNHARSYKGQTSTPEIINLEKSPDADIPSPEVTQVAGPAVTDNATPKMERKSKSFEPSLTCARDAEILTDEFTEQIKELIEAIKILAQEQHVDNQKIESRVEENAQIGHAVVQYLTEQQPATIMQPFKYAQEPERDLN